MPLDIFVKIIPSLDAQEVWQMKNVCSDWSSNFRQATELGEFWLQVPVTTQNLLAKALQLDKQRSSGNSFDVNVYFWLATPLPPAELLRHVDALYWQVSILAPNPASVVITPGQSHQVSGV